MDAQEAIRRLRERTEHEVTLPSGTTATVRLPNQQECILSGGIPMPVLQRMSKLGNTENGDAPEMASGDIEHILRFRREIARHTLVGLDGERIDDKITMELIDALDPGDLDALVAIGNREPGNLLDPNPLASVPTS